MNLMPAEAMMLIDAVVEYKQHDNNSAVICFTPFPYISAAAEKCSGSEVWIGAQNCSAHESGAFTGEVSAAMIAACGAKAVIIGHSERRLLFSESHESISSKLRMAFAHQLMPVWCCGETGPERDMQQHFQVIRMQMEAELSEFSPEQISALVIAYEPVWAIGTGKTASPEQAQEMHAFIRKSVSEMFGSACANAVRILYGGSCNPSNASVLFSLPDVDGGLIGGASLKPDDFINIIKAS